MGINYASWSVHSVEEKQAELERLRAEEKETRDRLWELIRRITRLEDELKRGL